MPVFYLLVIVAAFVIWLLCSALYKPIGKTGKKIVQDAVKAMNDDGESPEERKEENISL